jgi:hypothetical protein
VLVLQGGTAGTVHLARPGPDRYHAARFKGIGMTEAERRHVEAATRPGIGHTGPKGYLVGELGPYRPEPEPDPELEAG